MNTKPVALKDPLHLLLLRVFAAESAGNSSGKGRVQRLQILDRPGYR